jgi:uncharacterized MAPEG superfamily protein
MQSTKTTTLKVQHYFDVSVYLGLIQSVTLYAEDKMLPGAADRKNPEDIKRRSRVFANDIENIPLHTAVFWAAFIVQCFANLTGKGENETMALTVLIVLYCGFRLAYTFCYVYAIQPLRSILFALAHLAVAAAAIVMVISAFKLDTSDFLA